MHFCNFLLRMYQKAINFMQPLTTAAKEFSVWMNILISIFLVLLAFIQL
jgi:hypothetical protein